MGSETHFASAKRSDSDTIKRQTALFKGTLTSSVLDALPAGALLLNSDRQIIYCNQAFRQLTGNLSLEDLLGLRPGEALGCVHAKVMEAGCGTSVFCRHCGAAKAILDSLKGSDAVEECRMLRRESPPELSPESALDLQVFTSTVESEGECFTLFTILDVSHERRLGIVENFFFSEVLADVGTIGNLVDMLQSEAPEDLLEYCRHLRLVTDRVMEGIAAQRDLGAIETGSLEPQIEDVNVRSVLEQTAALAQDSAAADMRTVVVRADCPGEMEIRTDPVLLERILLNLLTNALEASSPGQVVTIGCAPLPASRGGGMELWVHNPAAMDEAVASQVFKRSFTTKGHGRGTGLYATRTYLVRFLQGSIDFDTDPLEGTTFRVRLPR